jgi:transposase
MDEHIKIFVGLDGQRLEPRSDRAPELALSGVRAGTDRRDRLRLAERSRAGELRAVGISGPADEAIRDVARAREHAVNARTPVRLQLKALLLRHDARYAARPGGAQATIAGWLSLSFGPPGRRRRLPKPGRR